MNRERNLCYTLGGVKEESKCVKILELTPMYIPSRC